MALEASLQNTFAVGGLIVENKTGKILAALHNNVLKPAPTKTYFPLFDPTAHGERQLVDWYFENRKALHLPPPRDLTVITTLDPCAMCAGALLISEFNVGISANDTFAGINYNARHDFLAVPEPAREAAQQRFGYYAVGSPISRPYQGSGATAFSQDTLSPATYAFTGSLFEASVNNVRNASSNSGLDPSKLQDPASLGPNSAVRQALTDAFSNALKYRIRSPRLPGKELADVLVSEAKRARNRGAAFNSVALIDPFGNLLLCLGGREDQSPIRTAFMEATRTYAGLRWKLLNSPHAAVRDEASRTLTHPKHGTFVLLFFPHPNSPECLMTLGAYGSTMEGPIPQSFPSNLQYVLLSKDWTAEMVAERAMKLPPFYSGLVQVAPTPVFSAELLDAIKASVAEFR